MPETEPTPPCLQALNGCEQGIAHGRPHTVPGVQIGAEAVQKYRLGLCTALNYPKINLCGLDDTFLFHDGYYRIKQSPSVGRIPISGVKSV